MAKSPLFEKLTANFGNARILSSLSPYLSERRRAKIGPIIEKRLGSVHVAVESPTDIHNALAIVRTSEALGLMHIHIIGWPKKRRGRETMQGADRWVEIHYYPGIDEFVQIIKSKGFALFGAAPRGEETLDSLPVETPMCLLFGNESRGLSENAALACDKRYKIPMFGFSESMNLSVSAAISLFDVAKRRRNFIKREGDLSEEEQAREKAWFCVRTLGFEQSRKILTASSLK